MRQLPVVLLLLALGSSVFADHAANYAAGRAAFEKGQLEKAVELFQKAIDENPKVADYHYMLGGAYGRLAQKSSMLKAPGLAKKAKAGLERAVQLDPRHFDAHFALLSYYLQAPGFLGGGEDKALAQAATMKKLDSLMGHRAYARVYTHQKKADLARKEMIEAVREQPKSGQAHYFLGNMYGSEKNWSAALHEYEQALQLEPSYQPTHFRFGWLAVQTGQNYARGEESLKKYLAYTPKDNEPSHASAWYYLGQLYEKQGRKADAKTAYTNAKKLAPEAKEVTEALKRVS